MKRLAIIIAVVIAVLAVAVAALPFVIPANFLKARVAAQISSLTGRPVTLTGEPSLSIYPHLAISVEGLAVGNPEGMGSDSFIAAETLHARVRLLPLLIGRVAFDEFELIKATLHLVVDAEGHSNWQMGESAIAAQAALPKPVASDDVLAPQPPDLQLGHLVVNDGTILYDDRVSTTREEITDVDIDVTWPSAGAAVGGRGSLVWRGETVEFTALLAQPLELLRAGRSPARFALASTPLRVSFSGSATGATALRLDGETEMSSPSLRRMIEWLGTPMGTGPILGAAAIRGSASITGDGVAFDRATVELDGNSAEGTIGITRGGRPALRGTLALDRLDLSAYVEAGRADLLAHGSWLLAPARLDFAQAINADLRISANEIVMGGTRMGKTAAAVGISNGSVDIAVGESEFHGGKISGRVTAGLVGETLVANGEAMVTDIPALVALTDLAGIAAIDGPATATFSLTGRGRSWAAFAGSVFGSGKMTVATGALHGVDLAKVGEALSDPLAEPVAGGAGTTAFSSLSATVTIGDGELNTGDLVMEGKDFRLTLAGRGSLFNSGVSADGQLAAGTHTLPLRVTGSWGKPVVARVRKPPARP